MLSALSLRVARLPRAGIIAVGLLLVAAIGCIDYATPPWIYLSIFYLLPVVLVAWATQSTACGLIMVVASCLVGPLEALMSGSREISMPVAIWNAGVRLAVFSSVLYLMWQVRTLMGRLQERALLDELTGLANLRALQETASREFERSRRFHHRLSAAYLDIDGFKTINDRAGHPTGDRVLITLASIARATVRSVDTVARVGGDEFVVLMPETGAAAAGPLAERLRQAFSRGAQVAGVPVTCSIGVASFEHAPASVEDMLAAADELMYEAKAGGGDAVRQGSAGSPRDPKLGTLVAFPQAPNL